MFDRLKAAATEMTAALAELDPDSMIGTQPASCLEVIRAQERALAAKRLALVARAEDMHPWQRDGYPSFEDWLAARDGTSAGKAKRRARTARQVTKHPKTARALEDGEISEDQADVVADAADQNPGAEDRLLDTARNPNQGHDQLADEAAAARAAVEDDRARARRLQRGRRAGWGTDRDGFWTLTGKLQPHVGAELQARLEAETDRVFHTARRNGDRESLGNYRADAIANLINGRPAKEATTGGNGDQSASTTIIGDRENGSKNDHGADTANTAGTSGDNRRGDNSQKHRSRRNGTTGTHDGTDAPDPFGDRAGDPADQTDQAPGSDPGATDGDADADGHDRPRPVTQVHKELVLVVDLAAYRRGGVGPGETCEIRGVGPVPVHVARAWAGDAFIKTVIRDGRDVRLVAHHGRHLPAHLRTALDLEARVCSVPGCANPRVECDHVIPHAQGGPTTKANLRPLCVRHHRQRTHHGHELTGEPGDRRWTGPDGTILAADDPDLVGTRASRTADPGRPAEPERPPDQHHPPDHEATLGQERPAPNQARLAGIT